MRHSEEPLIGAVVESLVRAFPHLPESHVRTCVLEIHGHFADAKVRTYLPILVARRARVMLSEAAAAADRNSYSVAAGPGPSQA